MKNMLTKEQRQIKEVTNRLLGIPPRYFTRSILIDDWNMNDDAVRKIKMPEEIPDLGCISDIMCVIEQDNVPAMTRFVFGGDINLLPDEIILTRHTGGVFHNTNYSNGGCRGTLIITYKSF